MPERGPDRTDDTVEIVAALAGLSEQQRVAIVLRYWADLPVAQVADLMHRSVSTVKSHSRRGRAVLAARLDHEEEVTP